MNEHLTENDMIAYAQIHTLTPENVAFVGEVNRHVFQCEKCKMLLDLCCAEWETNMSDEATRGDER